MEKWIEVQSVGGHEDRAVSATRILTANRLEGGWSQRTTRTGYTIINSNCVSVFLI